MQILYEIQKGKLKMKNTFGKVTFERVNNNDYLGLWWKVICPDGNEIGHIYREHAYCYSREIPPPPNDQLCYSCEVNETDKLVVDTLKEAKKLCQQSYDTDRYVAALCQL